MSVIDYDCFPNEDLLQMARQTVKTLKPYLENIVQIKPMLLEHYPTIDIFRKQRNIWERDVFIPSIENIAERTKYLEAWNRKRDKKRDPAVLQADQKLLKPFTKLFDDIVYQVYIKTGSKRARDRENEELLYETPEHITEIGVDILKQLFPDAKTIVECCAGNGNMVNVLKKQGYEVKFLDKFTNTTMVPDWNVYKDDIPFEFDVIFTNPPFKDKAKFLDVMRNYYEQGKGFCILIPFDSDIQKNFDAVLHKFPSGAVQKIKMTEEDVYFLKNGDKVSPVKVCWYVGGSSLTLPDVKILPTLTYKKRKTGC